jgi:hypothetical protein
MKRSENDYEIAKTSGKAFISREGHLKDFDD